MFSLFKNVAHIVAHIFFLLFKCINLRQCIEYYFNCWLLLHRPQLWQLKGRVIDQNRRSLVQWTLRTLQTIAAVRCLVWVALTVAPDRMSIHLRMMLWDQLIFAKGEYNMIYLCVCVFCIYMHNRMYYYANPKRQDKETVWLVLNYLLKGDDRFMGEEHMFVDYQKARKLLAYTLNRIQAYNLVLVLINVYYFWIIIDYVSEHFDYFFYSLSGIGSFLFLLVNGFSLIIALYVIMMEYFIQISIGTIFTYAVFTRFRQVNRILTHCGKHSNRYSPAELDRFYRLHTQILLDIFEANRLYGYVFLAFLWSAVPTSAYQMILIVTVRLHPFVFTTCLNIILYQMVINFGFHYMAAIYSKRIHACTRQLLHLNVCLLRPWGLVVFKRIFGPQFKLAYYTEKFHTNKHYGMTYASYGLITFSSFFKFVILYSELLMYCYRWIRKIK